MLVRPVSTVDNTRDYARVSHSRQWSNYNIMFTESMRRELQSCEHSVPNIVVTDNGVSLG